MIWAMVEPQLSLKRLEILCLVVETGGVTRAAEQMLVAQPAVSAQLRALEQWFGAPLFRRHAGRLKTTEAGDSAYRWAKETLARSASIRRYTQELAAGGAGRLVVAASLGVGTYLVPVPLTRLRAQRPGVEITVRTGQPEQAVQAVDDGEADFAVVTWYEHVLPNTLAVEELRAEPIMLCASVGGPPERDRVSIAELEALPFVGVPDDVAMSKALDAQLRAAGVGPLNVVMRLGHAESIKEAIYSHGWVSLMPRYSMSRDIALGRMRDVRVEGVDLAEQLVMVKRRDVTLSPLQEIAYAAVREALAPGGAAQVTSAPASTGSATPVTARD
jgi:LysR family transcriptional regulator, low CO2-responsive transcriptional regulator